MIDKTQQTPKKQAPQPQKQALHELDLSLIDSSPPNDVELSKSNALLLYEQDKEQPLLSSAAFRSELRRQYRAGQLANQIVSSP